MKALITGASSGIGREFALYLAELGYDLIICARRTDELNKLKEEIEKCPQPPSPAGSNDAGNRNRRQQQGQVVSSTVKNIRVRVITIDLSREQDAIDLYEQLKLDGEKIDVLINNAGFGVYGVFHEVPLEREIKLIHTNISSLHILTKLYLGDMFERNSGLILNVGSMAGFSAGPTFSSYYASKNYVVRLTEGVYEELRRAGSRVKISVLCPGPVNTSFNDVANVRFSVGGLNPRDVARYAFDKARTGKMIIIPGAGMKIVKFFQHFLSEKTLTRLSYNVQSRKDGNKS